MATIQSPISDLLVTVKAREVQRGMLAEMRRDTQAAARHYLAAAHLELVLADDYLQSGQDDGAFRTRLSAATCFWRAGRVEQARSLLTTVLEDYPAKSAVVAEAISELEQHYPPPSGAA